MINPSFLPSLVPSSPPAHVAGLVAGVGYSEQAQAFFARAAVPPSPARKRLYDNLFRAAGDIIAKCDGFYCLWGGNDDIRSLNLAQNAYNLTAVNAPDVHSDGGVTPNGSSSYYDTGFNPTTAVSPKFSLNDAHMGIWHTTDLPNGAGISYDCGNTNSRIINDASGNTVPRPNNAATGTISENYAAHKCWTRSAANLWEYYNNGVDTGGGTGASTSLTNFNFSIGRAGSSTFGLNTCAFYHFGSNLTAAEVARLYAAMAAFKAAATTHLENTQSKLAALSSGASIQVVILARGDSWIHGKDVGTSWDRGFQTWARDMLARYGDAGYGWCGFGYLSDSVNQRNNSSRPDELYVVSSTDWAGGSSNYYGGGTPDMGRITTTTAGAVIEWQCGAGQTEAKLFAFGASGTPAEVEYTFDDVTWTPLTLSGTDGFKEFSLSGVPLTAHRGKLRYLSGGTGSVSGVHYKNGNRGVRINCGGSTGSRMAQWRAISSASNARALQMLEVDLVMYTMLTNDQEFGTVAGGTDVPPTSAVGYETQNATYYFNTLMALDHAGLKTVEQLMVMPFENLRPFGVAANESHYTMASYSDALEAAALALSVAFYDPQASAGSPASVYGPGTVPDLLAPDLIHPSAGNGRAFMAGQYDTAVRTVRAA